MYLPIKTVTILDEIIQFLSGVLDHILMELNSMVYTKWPWEIFTRDNIFIVAHTTHHNMVKFKAEMKKCSIT